MLSAKMGKRGGGGEGKISAPPATPPLHQPSTGQAFNYNPTWRHRKHDLSSVPLQNNACTAGYSKACSDILHGSTESVDSFLIG